MAPKYLTRSTIKFKKFKLKRMQNQTKGGEETMTISNSKYWQSLSI